MEKMLKIINHDRNANQNQNELPFTPSKLAIILTTGNKKCWGGLGETGTLVHGWWECKMVSLLWKSVCWFPKQLKIELSYYPPFSLLSIYPKNEKWDFWTYIYTPILMAALFRIAQSGSNASVHQQMIG